MSKKSVLIFNFSSLANLLSFFIPFSERSIAVTSKLFFARKKAFLPSPQPKSNTFVFKGRYLIELTTRLLGSNHQ
jgi:hypothetical protein